MNEELPNVLKHKSYYSPDIPNQPCLWMGVFSIWNDLN